MTIWNFVETNLWSAIPGLGIGPARPLPSYATHAGSLNFPDQTQTLSFDVLLDPYPFSTIAPGSNTDFAFTVASDISLPGFSCCGTTAQLALNVTDGISGLVQFNNWTDALHMPVTNNIVTLGFAASDGDLLGCFGQCFFAGHWERVTHAPEPGFLGIAFLIAGLIAIASVHRYRVL